ncbi:radical SAM/SPASM domain-containing protein [Halorussus halobius]|uniref:radical SAM/SPASM domain-containing protein n=1 Tax=Halorussus halobius TaxID=1710537 RepID=UPI001091BB5C|nr:radical SAM/SPASM domain-containing protein [Halorussus halobius]
MQPVRLSVFLDYKCNFACDHCSVGSSPETEFEMEEDFLDSVFEQLDDVDSLQQVVFTGGEVTLHKERLLESIERASEKGYLTRIVSNGWWAHDMASAREMVDELVEAGLDELNTSYDDFHTDYMAVENIVNLVEASVERDMTVAVACVVGDEDPEYDRERIESLVDERLDTPVEQRRDVTLIEDVAAPLGSGAQLDTANVAAINEIDRGCTDVMNTLSVHPDGTVKSCCGHAMFYYPDLTMGSLHEEPLADIVERGKGNLIYWLIHEVGPVELIDRLDVDNDTDYANICHACGDLLGAHREDLFEYIRENQEELVRDDILLNDAVQKRVGSLMENREEVLNHLAEVRETDSEDTEFLSA